MASIAKLTRELKQIEHRISRLKEYERNVMAGHLRGAINRALFDVEDLQRDLTALGAPPCQQTQEERQQERLREALTFKQRDMQTLGITADDLERLDGASLRIKRRQAESTVRPSALGGPMPRFANAESRLRVLLEHGVIGAQKQ